MALVIPALISEQEPTNSYPEGHLDPAGMEDCVPCSMLMALNGLHPGIAPATLGEAEALRLAAGYPTTGGTSVPVILAAAQKRYGVGHVTVIHNDWPTIWAALAVGKAAVIEGRPAKLPLSAGLRQGEANFTGSHCVYVQRRSALAKVWTLDPIRASGPGFKQGFWTSKAELQTFYDGGNAAIFGIANQ